MEMSSIKAIIEAILFLSNEPVSLPKLCSVFDNVPKSEVLSAIDSIKTDLQNADRGLELQEIAGGYVLSTKPIYYDILRNFFKKEKEFELTPSAIETLAIIAYKGPITRLEIDAIRGVQSSGVIQSLLDKGLIKISGRKEVPGKPLMYTTTDKLLHIIGLKSLSDLPRREEVK